MIHHQQMRIIIEKGKIVIIAQIALNLNSLPDLTWYPTSKVWLSHQV